jgi:hypothetical protein
MEEVILTDDLSQLMIGDEIVTNSGSDLRYYRIMENPRLSKKTFWNGKKRYIAVKCQTCIEEKTVSGIHHITKQPWSTTYKTNVFKVPELDTPIRKVDLNFKNIVIVKRQ